MRISSVGRLLLIVLSVSRLWLLGERIWIERCLGLSRWLLLTKVGLVSVERSSSSAEQIACSFLVSGLSVLGFLNQFGSIDFSCNSSILEHVLDSVHFNEKNLIEAFHIK